MDRQKSIYDKNPYCSLAVSQTFPKEAQTFGFSALSDVLLVEVAGRKNAHT